jgi:crotonobetainyl-CoA:carnitine CoA-transferase CaiB-like acyl-CoA transferase
LNELLTNWTADQDVVELEVRLQTCGVPAHRVETSADLAGDPQLIFRSHFLKVLHRIYGSIIIEGTRFQLSRTSAVINKAGPTVGQHLHEVLNGILHHDDTKIAERVTSGAVG